MGFNVKIKFIFPFTDKQTTMNTKSILSLTAVAAALALLVAPLATEVSAYSFGDSLNQLIKQSQTSKQSSTCVNAGTVITTAGNCNNVNTQTNVNTGGNAAAQ